jgi:hypothetical protein
MLAATAIMTASHVATKASLHAAHLATTSPIMPHNDSTTISTPAHVNSTTSICQFPSIDKANNDTTVDYIPNIAPGSTIRQDTTYHASHYGLTTNATIYDRKPNHPQGKIILHQIMRISRKERRPKILTCKAIVPSISLIRIAFTLLYFLHFSFYFNTCVYIMS